MVLAIAATGSARLVRDCCGQDGAAGGRVRSDPASESGGLNKHATVTFRPGADASVQCTGLGSRQLAVPQLPRHGPGIYYLM